MSDTIQAAPVQGLVVQVTDSTGRPEAGVSVRFAAQSRTRFPGDDVLYQPAYLALVAGGPATYAPDVTATTDARGRALVVLRFSYLAGPADVVVTVPLYGLADTAHCTVLPGAAARVSLTAPHDTAIEAATSYSLAATVTDRIGNHREGTVAFGSTGPAVSVAADGRVTGASLGGAWVRMRPSTVSTWTDSLSVAVVPRARIAVSPLHGPIWLSSLTGGPRTILMSGNVNAQDWSPAGDQLVYVDDRGNGTYALSVMDTLGSSRQLPVPLTSTWPQFSADGRWIYFQTNGADQVYRIHPDGTGQESLLPGARPSPAPDGTRIAISTSAGIWMGDPVTKVGGLVPNTTWAEAVRWSPDGQWIAYRVKGAGQIAVIHPDGTGKRVFAADLTGGLAWSPDSRWILPGGTSSLSIIDLTTGQSWHIPEGGTYTAWRR